MRGRLKAPFAIALCVIFLSAKVSLAQRTEGTVEGRVLVKGQPAAGVRVGAMPVDPAQQITDSSQALVSLAQTDAQGRYILENIPAGRYLLVLGAVEAPVFFPGVKKQVDAVAVNVAGGASLKDRNFELSFPVTLKLRGRVVGDGRAAATQVMLLNETTRSYAPLTAPVNPDGTFEFPRLMPGRYIAGVGPLSAFARVSLVLEDEDIADFELNVPLSAVASTTVAIRTSVDGGGPLPAFVLRLEAPGTEPWRVVPISDAIVQQRLPLSEYNVRVMQGDGSLPASYFIKSMTSGTTDLKVRPLSVRTNGVTEVSIVLGVSSPSWVKVSGRVTGATAGSVNGIRLEGPRMGPLTAIVNPDGTFELPAVLPGTYQARLAPLNDTFMRPVVVGATEIRDLDIPVTPPLFSVRGRLSDFQQLQQQGMPGPGQRLEIGLVPDSRSVGSAGRNPIAGDGTFDIARVQSGIYNVVIYLCEGISCRGTVVSALRVVDKDVTNLAVSSYGTTTLAATPPVQVSLMEMARVGTPVSAAGDRLNGTIALDAGATVPSFRLRFTSGNITRTVAISGSSFFVELPPGAYTATVANLPEGFSVVSMTDGDQDLRSSPLIVGRTGTTSPSDPPRIRIRLAPR
jgi:hypothetical protein